MHDDPKDCWIKFNPDDFFLACKCLAKKYEMVDAKAKKAAIIEFDDIGMYERVLQYIKRMGGILEAGPNAKLDDEIDEESDIDALLSRKGKKRKSYRIKDLRASRLDDLISKKSCRVRSSRNGFWK